MSILERGTLGDTYEKEPHRTFAYNRIRVRLYVNSFLASDMASRDRNDQQNDTLAFCRPPLAHLVGARDLTLYRVESLKGAIFGYN